MSCHCTSPALNNFYFKIPLYCCLLDQLGLYEFIRKEGIHRYPLKELKMQTGKGSGLYFCELF